jgi:hypothetical protein
MSVRVNRLFATKSRRLARRIGCPTTQPPVANPKGIRDHAAKWRGTGNRRVQNCRHADFHSGA